MALKILTANLGRMLDSKTQEFLLGLGHEHALPDVLLLQDLPFRGLPLLERWPFLAFAPMTNHYINGVRAVVGIAIASRYFMSDVTHHTVWGDGKLKLLEGVNERNQRHLGEESDRLVEATEDRVVICATVRKNGTGYNLATTHGMWVRGGEIYEMLTEALLDCVPAGVETTLDPGHPLSRRVSPIRVVSDYVMTCPDAGGEHTHAVRGFVTLPNVSDHVALTAVIDRNYAP